MKKPSPRELIPAAKLLLRIIKENSDNSVCTETDERLSEVMECSLSYIKKLIRILKDNTKIKTQRIGSNERIIIE
jgi:hypothetical protein